MIRIVKMNFREDFVSEFLEVFHASKDKIRNFQGCERLELWQDLKDPTVFTTYSWWENEASLNRYRESELFLEVWKRTKSGFSAAPQANSYKSVAKIF